MSLLSPVLLNLTHTAPSAAPTNVSVSVVSSTALNVQWGPVPCIEQNGDITGYTVRVLESGEMERVEDVGDVNEVTISDLTPSTTYSIQVAAVNSEGTGPYSDLIIIDTPDSELYIGCTYLEASSQYFITLHIVLFKDIAP